MFFFSGSNGQSNEKKKKKMTAMFLPVPEGLICTAHYRPAFYSDPLLPCSVGRFCQLQTGRSGRLFSARQAGS